MLQWMGGSRRKVTTSRKSTQKRQKQYFEQRKRQQQEQNSIGLESYSDRRVSCSHHENNRSLDVLSLLNLSKNGQGTTKFPEGSEGSNDEHTIPNYQTAQAPNTIQMETKETKNLCPSEHVEVRETTVSRMVSNHLAETVCSQDHPDGSRRNKGKYPMKITTDHNGLCVIDMLGDDGENSSSRGNLVHENHVAFSVEGLGKVEMETPVHSPQHPARNFSYEPSKFRHGSHPSKSLNCSLVDQFPELEDGGFGVDDVATDASCLELPPYHEELLHNSKLKTRALEDCLVHNAQNLLGNHEYFDSRVEQDGFKWHEKSSFLHHNFVDDDCGLSWKNWSSHLDSSMVNHMRSTNYEKPDFSFEDIHMQKKRASVKAADCFNVSGLSSPYKLQMGHGYDSMTSNMTRTHCSAWPSFRSEDSTDSLSFLSEDSCLSRAGTKKPSLNFTKRQELRGHEAELRSSVNKFSTKKHSCIQELLQGESRICSGMHNRMPDFSPSRDDWLSRERCNIDAKSCYASMNSSETQKASLFGYRSWSDEPFDSDFNPKFYVDEKQSVSRSEHDALSGNLFSDKVAFCQQVSPGHSSPIISNIKPEYGHQESFNGFLKEEQGSPKIQFQESVSTGENKSVTLPAISSTLHQSSYSSSANVTPVNVSNSENNDSYSEETKVKTPELNPRPNAVLSPLRSEGGSSSVEMPQKLEKNDGCFKGLANSIHTSLLNQNEDKEDSGHGKRNLKCDRALSNVDGSCKVMMLGRFVLQLL